MAELLGWSDSFALGHSGLDGEHRAIVEAIRSIGLAEHESQQPETLRPLLCNLKKLVKQHFEHENAILHSIAAAAEARTYKVLSLVVSELNVLTRHIDGHATLGSELDTIIGKAKAHGTPVGGELEHWFVGHAVKADSHLKTLLQTIHADCPTLMKQLV